MSQTFKDSPNTETLGIEIGVMLTDQSAKLYEHFGLHIDYSIPLDALAYFAEIQAEKDATTNDQVRIRRPKSRQKVLRRSTPTRQHRATGSSKGQGIPSNMSSLPSPRAL